ncbi:MAG: ypdA 5 [Bacteroidetes bacterium]|nr:ypdA 5 [Bacteroidota bacterium]
MPSSECYDIKQDSKGYIWIATDRGVCRYDGYKFTTYTSEDGLTDNTVFTIHEDSLGRIWFLSFNGKLCWYKDGKIETYKYNFVFDKLYTGTKIARSFYIDKKNNITISYLNHGILQIFGDGTYKKNEPILPFISFFTYELDNKLMMGSWQPIATKKAGYGLYSNLFGERKTIDLPQSNGLWNIRGLKRKNGTYVFSAIDNVLEIEKGKEKVTTYHKDITTLFEDKDSCLWVGIHQGGVLKHNRNVEFNLAEPEIYLDGLTITSVIQDMENGYWLTTLEDGVYYMPYQSIRIVKMSGLSYKNVVTELTGDGKTTIFAGSNNGDIVHVKPGSLKVEKKDTSFDHIRGLFYDQFSDELWVASFHMSGKYKNNEPFKPFAKSSIRQISRLSEKTFIGIMGSVVAKFNNDSVLKRISTNDRSFRPDAIKIDKNNKVWVAATTGLYYLNDSVISKDTSVIKNERVIDIDLTEDNRLVLATIGSGVFITGQNKVLRIGTKQGLPSNIINGVSVRNNQLWLATNKGLSCVTLNGDNFSIRNYGLSNGIPVNDIRKIYLQNDKVWLGTNVGLIAFNPSGIPISRKPVLIYLEKVKVNAIPVQRNAFFAYQENFIEFAFTGISFRQRGNILYRYRLLGSNNEWTETMNTNVQFAALEPGNYTFELIAMNPDGIWNTAPLIYSFTIQSPFWQRPLFLVSVFILLFVATFLWYPYRLRNVRNRNKLVLQLQEYQRQALASQMNPHFIFNSLNSIHAFILKENRKDASKYLSSFSMLIRKCLDHSGKEYVPLKDEYNLLTTYLDLEVMRFKQKFIYEISIDPKVFDSPIQIPSMLLQPYIENSIYHGIIPLETRPGKISIRMFLYNEFLRCEIEDNGIGRKQAGMNKEENHESRGTDITEKRMKAYTKNSNYEFDLKITDLHDSSGNATGTRISFNLPYIKQ